MSSNTSNSPEAILAESVVAIERKDFERADRAFQVLKAMFGMNIKRGSSLLKQDDGQGEPPGV
jgi:hypothetical protein